MGNPRLKYIDTLMMEQGIGGKSGGRRTGEKMRERQRGESIKETILTDRERQTCKAEGDKTKGKTKRMEHRGEH